MQGAKIKEERSTSARAGTDGNKELKNKNMVFQQTIQKNNLFIEKC